MTPSARRWPASSAIRDLVRREVQLELAKVQTSQVRTRELVSVAEFAKTRSISVSTVRNAIRDGRLEATKIGTAVRVRIDAEIGTPVKVAVPPEDARVREPSCGRRF